MDFIPSKYQQAVFDWMANGVGHAVINAVAGSGKTTTLVEASKRIKSGKMLFAAFNRHIVKELTNRLPRDIVCFTIHSIGMRCLIDRFPHKKFDVQEFKYRPYCINASKQIHEILKTRYENLLAKFNPNSEEDLPDPPPLVSAIQDQIETIVSLARCTLTDAEDIFQMQELVDHFGIDCPVPIDKITYVFKNILDTGESDALENQYIDFTDMLWLPYKWNLIPGKYDWILVDEAQDLNAAQLHLVKKATHNSSRFLFVGDPFQAIYGFSGADAYSFSKIKEECEATEFPLSICYRCPSEIVKLASAIVPTIEAAPNSIPGEIISIKETDIILYLKDGDLILCRSTEPLIRTCFKLLSKKINAVIKGKDIRKSLVNIVRSVESSENFQYNNFLEFLGRFAIEKASKLRQKPHNERKLIELQDQVASIEVCYTSFNASSLNKFIEELETLFSEDNASITLSTIHKAKGLEEERIFLLYPEKLPLKWDKQKEWQLQQEMNLKYVALTRSKRTLYLVSEVPDQNASAVPTATILTDSH